MADEKVQIEVKFDVKSGQLRRAMVEMSAFEKRANRLASGRTDEFTRRTNTALQSVTKGWKRSFDFIDAGAKMLGKTLTKFLTLSIKGVIVEMALLGAAMVATHALFVSGQFVMKAYRGAMQVMAGAAGSAAVAIATVSAAIREQQAAIFAYRGKGAGEFGSAMMQTRMGMRNLQADASLASLGIENLNKAYGIMSKNMNVAQINRSGGALKALMDFGSAGQDPAKGLEQVANVLAVLSDRKKGVSDVIAEAKKLGPEMEKALKGANIKTKKQFSELLMSGDLAKKGGVSGQFDAVNSTLLSQLKGYFGLLRTEFADYGDTFLEPLKEAFSRVFNIIRTDLARAMTSILYVFGRTGFIDGFESAIEKTSNFFVNLLRDYLPKAQGMFNRISDWFRNFRRGWNEILNQTRPLIDGARIIYKAWDPIWEAIKRGAENLRVFRELLLEHEGDMIEFGERIAGFIDVMSDFFIGLKRMFADMAPFINDLVSGVTLMVSMLTRAMTMFAGKGFASALAPLLGFAVAGRTLSGVKGRLMPTPKYNTMNVTASVVNIGGLGAGPTSALPSGARPSKGEELANATQAFKTSGGTFGGSKGFASGAIGPSVPINYKAIGTMYGPIGSMAAGAELARSKASMASTRIASNNYNASMGLMSPGKASFLNAINRAQIATATPIGAARGLYSYMSSGAYDVEKGAYRDIARERAEIQQRFDDSRKGRADKIARRRELNRLNRSGTRFGAAYNQKFAQSGTGRMGAAMGLGLLSQVAPEEMRGSLALGGTLAQIDPRLGLAVGLGGAAYNARGAGKGALAGAGAGAAMGAYFGPMGALVGAGIGAVAGAIRGAVNKSNYELKEARKTAMDGINQLYAGIISSVTQQRDKNRELQAEGISLAGRKGAGQGLGTNMANRIQSAAQLAARTRATYEALVRTQTQAGTERRKVVDSATAKQIQADFMSQALRMGITFTDEQKKKASKNFTEFLKTFEKEGALGESMREADDINNKRIAALSRATGKSAAELEILADNIGINLYDATIKYDEVLGKFMKNLVKSGSELNDVLADAFIAGGKPFEQTRKKGETASALNANLRGLGDILRGKGTMKEKQAAIGQSFEQLFPQLLAYAGGDSILAYQMYLNLFGEKGRAFGYTDPTTKKTFQGPLGGAGVEDIVRGNTDFQKSQSLIKQNFRGEAATQIRARLAALGYDVDAATITTAMSNMTDENLLTLLQQLRAFDTETRDSRFGEENLLKKAFSSDTKTIETFLTETFGNTFKLTEPNTQALDLNTEQLKNLIPTIGRLIAAYKGEEYDASKHNPKATAGDTTSSRLARTMAKHGVMDSMLTGKRSVTSAFRTTGLGSPSSDHFTGNAYDLVGQNLGQYATLVRAGGGFAEMHGSALNRHLHVVPGQTPAIGDMSTPRRKMAGVGSSSHSVQNNYNITVNGGNSSPETIANIVMAKIETAERSRRQRR